MNDFDFNDLVKDIITANLADALLDTYRKHVAIGSHSLQEYVNMEAAREMLADYEMFGVATNETGLALSKLAVEFKDATNGEYLFGNFIQVLFHLSGMILEKNSKA